MLVGVAAFAVGHGKLAINLAVYYNQPNIAIPSTAHGTSRWDDSRKCGPYHHLRTQRSGSRYTAELRLLELLFFGRQRLGKCNWAKIVTMQLIQSDGCWVETHKCTL